MFWAACSRVPFLQEQGKRSWIACINGAIFLGRMDTISAFLAVYSEQSIAAANSAREWDRAFGGRHHVCACLKSAERCFRAMTKASDKDDQ